MTSATIKVNGEAYDGWKTVNVKRAIETISSVFSFDFTDSWSALRKPWGINPQDSLDIAIGGQRLIRGYAEVLNARLGTERSYTIQGRDRSCDIIDCSAAIKQYSKISLLDLCNAVASIVGVSFSLQSPGIDNSVFASWTIEPGESIFDSLDKACRLRGVLPIADGSGNVILSYAGASSSVGRLVEGDNCKTLGYTLDYSKRFSSYTVKGQDKSADGFFGNATSVQGISSDAGVRRKRPLIIRAENRATSKDAYTRAAWEANVRAARSTKIEVQVQGWLQAPGLPWLINNTVQLAAPKLGIGGRFLIAETEFSMDDAGGETTTMTLLPPDAFLSDPNVKKKKSDQVAKGFTFP